MNYKNCIVASLIVSQLLSSKPSFADESIQASHTSLELPVIPAPPGEVDLGNALSPLKKGQTAPFSGVLLSPKATATIVVQFRNLEQQIKVETDNVKEKIEAQCEYDKNKIQIQRDSDNKVMSAQLESKTSQILELDKIIKEHEKNKSNTPLWVGAGVGVGLIVGIGLTVLTAYSLNHATN